MQEQRNTRRLQGYLPVECLDDGALLMAHDISVGGMMITAKTPRWPGQILRLRVKLPGQVRAFRVSARVLDFVEVPRGVGMRLSFLALAPQAKKQVERFVTGRTLPVAAGGKKARMLYELDRLIDDCRALRRGAA